VRWAWRWGHVPYPFRFLRCPAEGFGSVYSTVPRSLVGEVDGSVGRTFRLEGDPAKHWQEGTEE
jgi:hypothetical protein